MGETNHSGRVDLQAKLRVFIRENFLFGSDDPLAPQDSLVKTGVIDSTGILELVTFIEEEFHLKIQDEELIPANLDTLDNLTAFIERKTRNAAG